MHDFNFVAFTDHVLSMPTFRHNASIHFNGYTALSVALFFEQIGEADGGFQVEYLAVQRYLHSDILTRCDKIGPASYFCHLDIA